MPANLTELDAWIDATCTTVTTFPNGCTSELRSLSWDYAHAVAKDLGASLLYGPSYSRSCWENFADSVRAWHRGDYDSAQLFRERAEGHAGFTSPRRRTNDGGHMVRQSGEWFHAASATDDSEPYSARHTIGLPGCSWCYLGAAHTVDAHCASARSAQVVPA
jgi:hypothetical protein